MTVSRQRAAQRRGGSENLRSAERQKANTPFTFAEKFIFLIREKVKTPKATIYRGLCLSGENNSLA